MSEISKPRKRKHWVLVFLVSLAVLLFLMIRQIKHSSEQANYWKKSYTSFLGHVDIGELCCKDNDTLFASNLVAPNLFIIDTSVRVGIRQIPIGFEAKMLGYNSFGNSLVVGGDQQIELYDCNSMERTNVFSVAAATYFFQFDDKLAVWQRDGYPLILDLQSRDKIPLSQATNIDEALSGSLEAKGDFAAFLGPPTTMFRISTKEATKEVFDFRRELDSFDRFCGTTFDIVVEETNHKSLKLVSWDSNECLLEVGYNGIREYDISSDGKFLAVAHQPVDDTASLDVYEIESEELHSSVNLGAGYPQSVSFSPTDNRIYVTSKVEEQAFLHCVERE